MKYFNTEQLSQQEIIDNLEAEAYEVEETDYFRPYNETEMMEVEASFLGSSKDVQKLEDEKKRLLEPIQAKLKAAKEDEKLYKRKVTDGGEQRKGKLYLMIDRDNRQIVKVDEEGNICSTRAMTAKERQMMIGESMRKIG